eukprot:Em0330g3a
MEVASEDRAAEAASTAGESRDKRKLWTKEERTLFEEALKRHGPSSNIVLANAIGSKTKVQVGNYKRAFLLKNPNWLEVNVSQPPPLSTTIDICSFSPPPSPSSPSRHVNVSQSPPLSGIVNVCSLSPPPSPSSPSRHVNVSQSPPLSGVVNLCSSSQVSIPLPATPPLLNPYSLPPHASRLSNVPLNPDAHTFRPAAVSSPTMPHPPVPPPLSPRSLTPPLSPHIPNATPTTRSPSMPTAESDDINATLRAPFLQEVRSFSGRALNATEWEAFCQTLLRWADKLRVLTTSFQPRTRNPTTGWARRRNAHRRPPPPSLIEPQQETTPAPSNTNNAARVTNSHHRAPGRQRNVAKARELQRLYRTNPSVCIRKILDDTPPSYCAIPEAELVTHFTSTYSAARPLETAPPWLFSRKTHEDILDAPFSPLEIQHQLRRAKKTAPGADKLSYGNWKWADPEGAILSTIFNICRSAGKIPAEWKRSAVTLLPKGGDGSIIRNWRPICLQNNIYKLYSGAIARRIADWAISSGAILPSQKGFLPYDGCVEHSFVLRSLINDSRRRKRNILLAWLDLRDAFGSVSHELLLLMMSRIGLCGKTLEIVGDIYQDSTIAIKTGRDSFTPDIPQRRGVKQGCPLSPVLFNIALEGLLRHLAACNYGYRLNQSISINHLAYADDICVIADSRQQGQALLDRCTEFTTWAGLTFNPQKCGSLCSINNVSPIYVDPTPLHLNADNIPAMSWRQRYKYLGCPVGAESSHDLTAIRGSLLRDCEKIMTSHLAEWQRLDAFRRFLFPRLTYVLKVFFPGSAWCRKLDTNLRKWLKKAVCLPMRAKSSFLYTPQSAGGLGIPSCEDEMHVARVVQAFKFLADTRDPSIRLIARQQLESVVRKRTRTPKTSPVTDDDLAAFLVSPAPSQEGARGDVKSLWSSVRASLQFTNSCIRLSPESATLSCGNSEISWSKRKEANHLLKHATQSRHLTDLQEAPDQGRSSYSTSLAEASNYFTYTGAYLTFPQYRFALRARLNLLPTRTVQARCGKRITDTCCRQCHLVPETLSHLTNHCLPNMGMIRDRHNAVLERLIRAIPPSMGNKFKEQPLPETTGANRPDLTIISTDGNSAILVDVCVPFEGSPEALHEAAAEKISKYEPLRQTLLNRFQNVEVFPFVIGSLGSWFPPNDGVLKRLRIGHKYAALMRRLCVASAIAGSQNIWFHSACSRPGTNIPNRLQPHDPPIPPTLPHR